MTLTADKQVHANVVNAWKAHKAKTGISQTRAAQSLGIGQSAFHQYLKGKDNGGIPLNRNFVVKFSKLVGSSPEDLGWTDTNVSVREAFLPIKFNNLGAEIVDEKIAIESVIVPSAAEFAVRVDSTGICDLSKQGDIFVCTDSNVRGGDTVFVRHVTENKRETWTGRLASEGTQVTCSHGGASFSVDIPTTAKVYRILAVYFRR